MADISIDKLSFSLSGVGRADGERLARAVAEKLGAARASVSGGGKRDSLKVDVRQGAGDTVDYLAAQIVEDLIRQLNRVG
jgi:hypothetical protein